MRRIKALAIVTLLSLIIAPMMLVGSVSAAGEESKCADNSSIFLGLPTWYKYLDYQYEAPVLSDGEVVKDGSCEIDFKFPDDIGKILLAVVEIVLYLGGIIAVGLMLVGGFKYMTSQGNPDATKAARQTIQNAFIGLVIAIFASVTVGFIARYLTK